MERTGPHPLVLARAKHWGSIYWLVLSVVIYNPIEQLRWSMTEHTPLANPICSKRHSILVAVVTLAVVALVIFLVPIRVCPQAPHPKALAFGCCSDGRQTLWQLLILKKTPQQKFEKVEGKKLYGAVSSYSRTVFHVVHQHRGCPKHQEDMQEDMRVGKKVEIVVTVINGRLMDEQGFYYDASLCDTCSP